MSLVYCMGWIIYLLVSSPVILGKHPRVLNLKWHVVLRPWSEYLVMLVVRYGRKMGGSSVSKFDEGVICAVEVVTSLLEHLQQWFRLFYAFFVDRNVDALGCSLQLHPLVFVRLVWVSSIRWLLAPLVLLTRINASALIGVCWHWSFQDFMSVVQVLRWHMLNA